MHETNPSWARNKIGFLEANIAFGLARDDVAPQLREVLATLLSPKS